jgi:hypothetical protein
MSTDRDLLHKAHAFLAGPIDEDMQDAAHALAAQIWDYLHDEIVTVARVKRGGLIPMNYDVAAEYGIFPADDHE